MEQEFTSYACQKCGNKISFTDSWQEGHRMKDDVNIKCLNCGEIQTHRINDTISDLQGGVEV